MKLLFVISTMDGGGAARIVGNLTTHLPEDWDIDILVNNSDTIAFPYSGRILSLGISLPDNREGFLYQIKVLSGRLKKLRTLKNTGEYDCCISYMDSANFANILTRTKKCKTVLNVVNNMSATSKFHTVYRYVVNPVIKLFYNKADRIIALSEDVRRDLINTYGIRPELLSVSYCSIDVKTIDNLIAEKKSVINDEWFNRDRTVVTAGRMERQKGQWHLIRAFSRVIKEVPDAKLAVFGFGSLREYYSRLINDYGMQNNVRLYDFSSDLTAYISKSAIFVFPSLYEGFGTALQEALACDVACMATDYPSGGREQLSPEYTGEIFGSFDGEYGILIEACSEELSEAQVPLDTCEIAMADSVIELLTDSGKREDYAARARERSYAFDIEKIARDWIADIERI